LRHMLPESGPSRAIAHAGIAPSKLAQNAQPEPVALPRCHPQARAPWDGPSERPRYARVRPMPTPADMLKNTNAYRSACGDLCAGALRLSPQELADLTLQVAGQSPQRARQIVAEHLSKERKRRPSRRHLRQHRRSHRRHRSPLHMCNICRRPRS
jgi:hypothetical protein